MKKIPKLQHLITLSSLPVVFVLLLLYSSCAENPARPDEEFPIVEVLINNSTETIDDYVKTGTANNVPCTIKLLNYSRFSSNIAAIIRPLNSTNGGQISFSLTTTGTPAVSQNISIPSDGSTVNFFVIGTLANVNAVFGDVAIEVVEDRPNRDNIILARKPLMVTDVLPALPAERIELEISGSPQTIDDYITWSPTYCRARIKTPAAANLPVTLTSESYGGQLAFGAFGTLTAHVSTATNTSLNLSLPADGSWVEFHMAGLFNASATLGMSSRRDKDAIVVVRKNPGGELLGRWATMVRVRKNANTLSTDERDRFLNAIVRLNDEFLRYPEYYRRHQIGVSEAHGGPGFLPWHRAFVLQLERELQALDPSVALHYWRFDQAAPNVFHRDFMGDSYNYINPTTGASAGINDWAEFASTNPLFNWTSDGVPGVLRRTLFPATGSPSIVSCGGIRTSTELETLALGTEYFSPTAVSFSDSENNPHGIAHILTGGLYSLNCATGDYFPLGYISDVAISPRDPLFFLLHSNVERLWAKWQWVEDRLDPTVTSSFSPQGAFPPSATSCPTIHIGHYADDTIWPWNKVTGNGPNAACDLDDRPTTSLTLRNFPSSPGYLFSPPQEPRVKDMIDYRSMRFIGEEPMTSANSGMGYCYDDVNF